MAVGKWDEIERLFSRAHGMPFHDRRKYLTTNASTPDIADKVDRLLAAEDRLSPEFMQTGIEQSPVVFALAEGEMIDGWEIVRPIAHGGMGEVYEVKRTKDGFEQFGALKLTRGASPRLIEHFMAERQFLANLEHANIGRLIDGGTTPSGQLYMVMELIEGKRITDFAKARKLSIESRIKLFQALCNAVSFAHSLLVLHRDIKPENVLVTANGDVKLIDFGVASLSDPRGTESFAPITAAYAAPEQIAGCPVSVQTDVYALGRILSDLVTDASVRSERDLIAIICKATADDPQSRYSTVAGLRDDLERYLKTEPVIARDGSRRYRFTKFLKRHQFAAAGFSLAFLALSTGLIVSTIMADRAGRAARTAEAALIEAEKARIGEQFESRTLLGYRYGLQSLYGGDEESGDLIDPERIDASLRKIVSNSLQRADDGNLSDAYMIYAIGQNFMYRGDFASAAQILGQLNALDIPDLLLRVELQSDLAKSLHETGADEEALRLARLAMKRRPELYDDDSSGWIQDAATISAITKADEDYQILIDVLEAEIEAFDPETSSASDLAWLYNQLGSTFLQKREYGKVTAAFRKAFETDRNERAVSLNDLSAATNLAQFEIYFEREADYPLSYLPDYLALASGEFGDDPLRLGFIHGLMAEAYLLKGEWSEAQFHSAEAKNWLKPYPNFRNGWFYDVSIMQAKALGAIGERDRASEILESARSQAQIDFEGEIPALLRCKMRVAEPFVVLQSEVDAAQAYDDAYQFCEAELNPRNASWLIVRTHLATAERAMSETRG